MSKRHELLVELPKTDPDLMIYIKASIDTVRHRIGLKGSDFEGDEGLDEYYRLFWSAYNVWLIIHYNAYDVLIIDTDKVDIVNNPKDVELLVKQIKEKLSEMGIK